MSVTRGPGAASDVSVVVVSYNTRDVLRDCLASLAATAKVSIDVTVVDNGSADGSAEMIEREFPWVTLVRNRDNRGFAAANNVAIPGTRGRYVLLLNPDTEVEPLSIAALTALLDGDATVGLCGPRVLNSDGSLQSCGYRFPTLRSELCLSRPVSRALAWIVGPQPQAVVPDKPADVDWVDGCCLLIRRTVIDRIGLLDEQFFLYGEELDWCFNARRAGWRILALPDARIVHHRAKSTEQVKARALALLVETRLRYYRKNRGLHVALTVAAVYVIGFVLQLHADREKNLAKLRGVKAWFEGLFHPALVVSDHGVAAGQSSSGYAPGD